jgi:HPt (histidine-containing phosphotransfer) domain-containing protein
VSLLNYLSDGTEQGLGEQIERFLATLTKTEDQLEHASSARDFTTLAASAHHVLSQAKMIGGTALETAATALERAARAQNPAAFETLFKTVRREIRAVTEALRRRHPATYAA